VPLKTDSDWLALGLIAVSTHATPAESTARATALASLVATIAGRDQALTSVASAVPLLGPLPCRFSTQQLVDLLKHPMMVGQARRILLDHLEGRYKRPFSDHWAFVRFAEEQQLGLDFSPRPATSQGGPGRP
jgi:hypothetical protein